MNKYQEALDTIKDGISYLEWLEEIKTLEELINKENPKKVVMEIPKLNNPRNLRICYCPNCNSKMGFQNLDLDIKRANYCYECGQALDWSNDE